MKESPISRFGPYPADISKHFKLLDVVHASLGELASEERSVRRAAAATLVVTRDGSPLRSVLTGSRVITTGFLTSRKVGCALPFEGMNEAALLKYCEVDTRVVYYLSQPFRFEFVLDGKKRIYIADCVRVLDDGAVEVVEVKGERTRLDDPDYFEKLEHVAEHCANLGWRFKLVTRRKLLDRKTIFANVDFIQARRQAAIDVVSACRAVDHLAKVGGRSSLGRLAEFWGNWQVGLFALQGMMVRRWLAIDVTAPISPDSLATTLELAPLSLLGRGGQ